jgi:SAM-dependent methyltransferase
MEELPWPDRSFDVVTGFNAFQYALDVDLALAEARRVARPRGRLVICKWARPHENELFAFLLALGADRRLPASDLMDGAVARAGVDVVATDHVPMTMHMPDEAALEAAVIAAGAERRGLRQAAAPFRQPDGSYRFHNRLRYVIARA